MKKLQLLMFAAVTCLAFTSCSDDDDNNGNNNVDDTLRGTYELTSLTAPTSQDYDNDGDSNTNLVLEGSCYNESWISFHDDGTYDESASSTTTANGGFGLDCDSQISSGTYTQNGNTITTTRTSGGGNMTATYMFNSENHTITRTQNNGSYTGWNNATSVFGNLTGNLSMTFTKYSDDDNNNGAGQNDDDNIDSDALAASTGTFSLSSMVVGSAQDLNNDGTSSTDLATEGNCYSESSITLNSNGTYSQNSSTSILGVGGLSLDCNSETTSGTWIRQGDRIITRSTENGLNINTEYMFDSTTSTLQNQNDNGQYAGYNSVTSLYSILSGSVNSSYIRD